MRCPWLVLVAVAALNSDRLSAVAPAPDPLPTGAVAQFGSTRFQDFTIGGPVAFSPDGKLLATGGSNTPVCVWDAATGKLVRTHSPGGSTLELQWKPDGKLAALAYFGTGGVFMYEWSDGPDDGPSAERMQELRKAVTGLGRKGFTGQVLLSADARHVVIVWNSYDRTRRAEVVTFTPNQPTALAKAECSIPLGNGYHVWLSRDAKTLIAHQSGSKGGEERIAAFDLTAKKEQVKPAWEFTYKAAGDHRVTHCRSSDGKRVVLRFLNGGAELWDGPAGKLIRELPKIPGAVFHWGGVSIPASTSRPMASDWRSRRDRRTAR